MTEPVIKIAAEVIKYGFTKPNRRRTTSSNLEYLGKQKLIDILKAIGVEKYWLSRDWVSEIHVTAGFGGSYELARKWSLERTILYFNLIWTQGMPKELAEEAVMYLD